MLYGIGCTHVEQEDNNADSRKSKYQENPA